MSHVSISSFAIGRAGGAMAAATLLAAALGFAPSLLRAEAVPGVAAPAFSLPDAAGRSVSLAEFKGRTVFLEWVNPGCPFVQKHYETGNMQQLQGRAHDRGVVWLSISSTHPGHGDYLPPARLATRIGTDWKGTAAAILMDDDGTVGRRYGARTTPQMVVIDGGGTVVFAGGIDDRRSARQSDVKIAKNFVAAALDDLAAGRPVQVASAPPYGCSVKYP